MLKLLSGFSASTLMAIVGVLIAAAAFGGWKGRDMLCDAAEARAALALERLKTEKAELELKGYRESGGAATKAVEVLTELREQQNVGLKELQDILAKRPVSSSCLADDDLIRRLLSIPR